MNAPNAYNFGSFRMGLVLDANPPEAITNTRRISMISLRWKELDRQALRAGFLVPRK